MPITAKLDELGKPAWIAVTILGFMVWWPLGLATLAFIIGSGRMGCWRGRSRWQDGAERMSNFWSQPATNVNAWWTAQGSSGNKAFDEYRAETLRRLEEEQREFKDFLERLRAAKDKSEFDQFMADRRRRAVADAPSPQG